MYSDKLPILSGDVDSNELSENQAVLVDMIRSVGKIAVATSESPITIRVERRDGLTSFLRKVQEAVDSGKPLSREQVEKLEKEVRYNDVTDNLGNRTEVLRMLLGHLHNNDYFKKTVDEVIKETINLSNKRAMNRRSAERTTSEDLGL